MSSVEYDTAPAAAPYNTPPALIAFTLGVLVVCFIAFSIVYLCKYCFFNVIHIWAFQRTASGSLIRLTPHGSPVRGLEPALLQVFPTFLYSSVKDLRKEKYSLECAICLLEFEDDNMLRLLTLCCHVFHKECIDLWLRSHKTCPVCRRDLNSLAAEETQKLGDVVGEEGDEAVAMAMATPRPSGEVRIDVTEGEEENVDGAGDGNRKQEKSDDYGGRHDDDDGIIHQQGEQMFVRSHSTGHSIVMIRGDEDEGKDDEKYTLRLPEHVLRVRQNKHNCMRSCASYKDITTLVATAAPCSNCGFVQPLSIAGCSSTPGQSKKS